MIEPVTTQTLQNLAIEIHEENIKAGWWNDYPCKWDRCDTAVMLIITEIAEAVEGWRKDLQDNHLPQYKMYHVEIADTLIRLLDCIGAYKLQSWLHTEYKTQPFYTAIMYTNTKTVPEKLVLIVKSLFGNCDKGLIDAAHLLLALADYEQIDILKIIDEKRAYNKQRADHKLENRAKKGGKKI